MKDRLRGDRSMTTKAPVQKPAECHEALPDDLTTAYQVHTLAQMLYMRLAAAPDWIPMVQAPFPSVLH
jgi:hypothetical protein